MKSFTTLATVLLVGCATPERVSTIFSGGNGTSDADAIIPHQARGDAAVLAAEQDWLRYRYTGARIVERQRVVVPPNPHGPAGSLKQFELLTFATAEGDRKTVYFDITDF